MKMRLISLICCFYIWVSYSHAIVAQSDKANNPIIVTAGVPTYKETYTEIYVNGKAKAKMSQDVYARTPGKVNFIHNKDTNRVLKGETVMAIGENVASSALESAKNALEASSSSLRSQEQLYLGRYISKQALESARAAHAKAKYDLDKALQNYSEMVIKAQFDGVVSAIPFSEGNEVMQGDYLFSIVSGEDKILMLNVPEKFLPMIDSKSKILVKIGEKYASAKIQSISQSLNKYGNGMITTTITAPEILHGSFVQAKILLNPHFGKIIPASSIIRSEEGIYIYVVRNKIAKKVQVQLESQKYDTVEIKSDEVKLDDLIVFEGANRLTDGTEVEVKIQN